jgi:DNA polymerase-1
LIEFDVETTGLQPWSGNQAAFMYQFFDGELCEVLRPENDEERIQWWFDRGKTEGIRAWNTKFDRAFADIAGFDLPPDGMWYDGMILAHALDENKSLALKSRATDLLGAGSDDLQIKVKDWLKNERARRKKEAEGALTPEERRRRRQGKIKTAYVLPNYSDVPAEIMEPYGAEDVLLTRKVCDIMEPQIAQSSDLSGIVEFERDVLDALYAVEKRGFPVDAQGYRLLENEVIDNIEALEEDCIRLAEEGGVEDFNPNSTAQIITALKGRKADMSFMSEKNGKLSADRENLEAVDDELAAAILEFRSEAKAHSTYIKPYIRATEVPAMAMIKDPFIGPDGRIHANYRQVGTKTGRMSCSDPNLQNQPRDDLRLRYNMRADPGFKLVTCDLSNVEMRIFAAYAGKGRLLQAIIDGEDMHEMTAEFIGIRDRQRAGGTYESARQRGKTFNFSVVYGGGVRTIRKQQRVSQDEARLMLQRYKDAYPEVVRLQNRIAYQLQDKGYIRSAWGRRFHVDVRDAYKGVNYLVQGTAADLLKASLIRLHQEGVPIVACVHDELIAHVPEDQAEETRDKIITALTDHPRIVEKVPLTAEGDIVDRWSDAKALKDEDGREYLFTPQWAGGEKRYIDA